jgi:hypothetical protein
VVAALATEVRTGAVAAGAAVATTLLLYQLSAAFPGGTRVGAGLAALLAVVVIGGGGFALTAGSSDERAERFSRILTPGEDATYSTRIDRWEDAWPKVTEEPLGHGLGTSGAVAAQGGVLPVAPTGLDSSYLKIGIEQGPIVMVLFIAALIALLVGLAGRAIATSDQTAAALGIGACGTVVALLVFFYTGFYVEHLQTLGAWLLIGIGAASFTGSSTSTRGSAAPRASGGAPP